MNPGRMRTVHVDEPDSSHTLLWLAGGAVLGLVAGVMLADRIKGRSGSLRSLANRGRKFASGAWDSLGPILETARSLKEAWDEPDDDELEDDQELDPDETEAALDDDVDEESEDEDDEERNSDALDERVLEAFVNDPILMERSVEIEERDPGVIILYGRMRSAKEAKHAMTIARGVPGVERVRARLTVR